MPQREDPKTSATVAATVLGVLGTAAAIGVLMWWYEAVDAEHRARVSIEVAPVAIARARDAARARLASYGWVDRAAGIVHVPLARAQQLVLAERAAGASFVRPEPVEGRTGRGVRAPTQRPAPTRGGDP